MQETDPEEVEYDPAAQLVTAESPEVAQYEPAGQDTQDDEPVEAW